MIKSELIMRLAEKQDNLSLRDIESSINHLLDKMSNSLAQGRRIEIRGFGSFSLHYRPPRQAHNPKTGAHVQTYGKYTPHFKPGKDLRERVIASFEQGNPIIESKDDDEALENSIHEDKQYFTHQLRQHETPNKNSAADDKPLADKDPTQDDNKI